MYKKLINQLYAKYIEREKILIRIIDTDKTPHPESAEDYLTKLDVDPIHVLLATVMI